MNESTLVPREEISNLDWLARNVHAWPYGMREVLVRHSRNVDTLIWSCVLSNDGWITKDQWLARRAELQNKPSWEDAPEWANWLAQDEEIDVKGVGGGWFWYERCPTPRAAWDADDGLTVFSGAHGAVLGDWRDTLEKRPEQKAFDPFVSVEDAATATQLAITPSKYTKTIHGVSVDVYDVLQAWGVSNPALQHLIKKALQCGQRGHKDNAQDLQDIIDSAIRAKELEC